MASAGASLDVDDLDHGRGADPVEDDDAVALVAVALALSRLERGRQDLVRGVPVGDAGGPLGKHREQSAHEVALLGRALSAAGPSEAVRREHRNGDRQDGHHGLVLGDQPRRLPLSGQHDDERRMHLVRRPDGGGGERLQGGHGHRGLPQDRRKQRRVVDRGLRLLAYAVHDFHGLHGVVPGGCLAGEHHAVGAVEHGVGDVGCFGTRRAGALPHRLQHLGRRYHGLASNVAFLDHHLLREEDLLGGDLHAEVAARDHDAVGLFEDGVKVGDALLVLYLGDDVDPRAFRPKHLADVVDVLRLPHEGGCNGVDLVRDAPVLEVLLVLGGECGEVHDHARQVDVLSLPEHRAVDALGPHGPGCGVGGEDLEHDGAIGAEDVRAGADILGELLVADGDQALVPNGIVVRRDGDLVARDELHRLPVLEEPRPDLGALCVEHHGAEHVGVCHRLLEVVERLLVVVVAAVGEVEAGHAHAGAEELLDDLHAPADRAERADDLGFAYMSWSAEQYGF
mmetsp:Transcript_15049/g.35858  ORF Transcript_15049/g.35858 Transcript_15049/m.35858 type:complete len:510 (+) Transcript_15049:276-1805(+)